ncbi:MAG: GNAT family N-acetyltransferase [Candidatus Roizmanbacteria bacterium]
MNIRLLDISEIEEFFPYYSLSMQQDFSEYTEKTTSLFVNTIYNKEYLLKNISSKQLNVFVLVEDNKYLAYAVVNKIFGGVVFCTWLAVDISMRGKGIGSQMLAHIGNYYKELGAHKMMLWCIEKNIPFYEKCGFVVVGKVPQSYFGTDDYFLYKILQEAKEENYLK